MSQKSPISVLHITIGDGNFGGVASFLYTYYAHMDHNKVHFDILYCGENSLCAVENDPVFADTNITAFHILKKNNNGINEYKKLIPALRRFFAENDYDIVHVSSGNSYLNASVAYILHGKSVYIAHSHSAEPTILYNSKAKQLVKNILKNIIRLYVIKKAQALYACSEQAGKNLFGILGTHSRKFKVINNAIDVNAYAFRQSIRSKVRKNNKIIIGFVGRLADEKNPLFALEVFSLIIQQKPNSELWIIGDGDLKTELVEQASILGINNKVFMMGFRSDVSELMQGMDLLLFPSIYEGLGIVAIEAQCSGLPVIASENVPKEANLTGLMTYLHLSDGTYRWAQEAVHVLDNLSERQDKSDVILQAHYGIQACANDLQLEYERLYEKRIGHM